MIKSIEFKNFRNLTGKYELNAILTIICGQNNTGKTNFLDGIRLAFASLNGDYFKVCKTDFRNSDDTQAIKILVELTDASIPSLVYKTLSGNKTGFSLTIHKTSLGKYVKDIRHYDESPIDFDILRADDSVPNVFMIPLLRVEDVFSFGLTTNVSTFLTDDNQYHALKETIKEKLIDEIKDGVDSFKNFTKDFDDKINIIPSDPKVIDDDKLYVTDGSLEHNRMIGSGYKSLANIFLNTVGEKYSILLIDEIENHLHPSMLRKLLRKLKEFKNVQIVTTTHSPIVINESPLEDIIDISGKKLNALNPETLKKINAFLHPGRAELIFAENIILVEGYSEELLLNNYLKNHNPNWTVVNVAGVMFEPYIELAHILNKNVIVISDNDILLSEDEETPSSRFLNLKAKCNSYGYLLIEVDNTLETDLYNNSFITSIDNLEAKGSKGLMVAKKNKKTEIAHDLIASNIDLSDWHVIKKLNEKLKSN